MSDHTSLLSLEDRDLWTKEHRDGGLPCQSWDYGWALAASGINPRLAVVRAGGVRMLLPFFEREWRGTTDIATIVGLSGASIAPSSAMPLGRWRQFAIEKGWVAGYIQLSVEVALAENPPPDELVDGKLVFLLDLATWTPWSASPNIRKKFKRAVKGGVALVDERPALAERLKSLYPMTMRRLGASPHLDLLPETLDRLAHAPSSLILGANVDGVVEIVALFLVAGYHAEGHIIGTTEHGREFTAWLYLNGIDRLRDQGVRVLNLGGGARPGDGVFRFKQRFGASPKRFRAVRQIYDRAKYDKLCRDAGVTRDGAWFPSYRIPLAQD